MHDRELSRPLNIIKSYHAHIYFEGASQRLEAEALREEIGQRFLVLIGSWHDRPVGPHTRSMYQIAFNPAEFAVLVPWLMINRRGLAILVHPNTGRPKHDHLTHALWLGERLNINGEPLPEVEIDDEAEIVPNTHPTTEP